MYFKTLKLALSLKIFTCYQTLPEALYQSHSRYSTSIPYLRFGTSFTRIIRHIELSPNFNHYHSAYCHGHSTETTILRHMLCCRQQVRDTPGATRVTRPVCCFRLHQFNIPTLVHRLEYTFGLSGTAL